MFAFEIMTTERLSEAVNNCGEGEGSSYGSVVGFVFLFKNKLIGLIGSIWAAWIKVNSFCCEQTGLTLKKANSALYQSVPQSLSLTGSAIWHASQSHWRRTTQLEYTDLGISWDQLNQTAQNRVQ